MTERRPWWTDDLIDAVIRAESDAHDYEYRAMAAIAAVEDWQENEHELAMQEMRGHKAAIARVRELLEPYVPCPSHDDDCDSVICALRLALGLPLDGDGDE